MVFRGHPKILIESKDLSHVPSASWQINNPMAILVLRITAYVSNAQIRHVDSYTNYYLPKILCACVGLDQTRTQDLVDKF